MNCFFNIIFLFHIRKGGLFFVCSSITIVSIVILIFFSKQSFKLIATIRSNPKGEVNKTVYAKR